VKGDQAGHLLSAGGLCSVHHHSLANPPCFADEPMHDGIGLALDIRKCSSLDVPVPVTGDNQTTNEVAVTGRFIRDTEVCKNE
jgi:hypothetical protein